MQVYPRPNRRGGLPQIIETIHCLAIWQSGSVAENLMAQVRSAASR
jgi:hypothetical protein